MEFRNYYLLLKKHKLTLVIIPLIAIAATWFGMRFLPDNYTSKTQIATGIVDQTQQVMGSQEGYVQDSKILQQFTNLMESIKLNKVVDQVAYQLLIHDLTSSKPFRNPDKKLQSLSPVFKKQAVAVLNNKLNSFGTLNISDPFENKVNNLVAAMGYDHDKLLKKIQVYHNEGSDFINIDGSFENPQLSAFIVNNLTDKFIAYYTNNVNAGHNKANDFLGKLLLEKRTAMNNKIAALEAYKIKNGILDMGDESKDVYGQISDIETHKQQAEKDVIAYTGALKGIQGKFDPKDRQYLEATTSKINGKIVITRERLRALNDKYIQSGFNQRYKKSVDSLQDVLTSQINESSDKYISNPLVAKDNLVQEKLKMENELELARYSANSLNNQLATLKGRINNLVPAEAVVKSMERDIDIATKEYLDVQDKYNQANVSTNVPIQLRQLQAAMPGSMQPSKKILIVALSGITSFIFCLVVLLIVFYLDDCIRNSEDLVRLTKIPVLGQLNFAPSMMLDSKKRRVNELKNKNDMQVYRDMLRSIRFEIDQKLKDGKVLTITSLSRTEGKTLFSFSLAYAYALINKKVLLIDGNFSHPAISETVNAKDYLEDFFRNNKLLESPKDPNGRLLNSAEEMELQEITSGTGMGETLWMLNSQSQQYDKKASINVLGNRGGDTSLLEISDQFNIKDKLDLLKSKFDVIIIETGPLSTLNKSKEWMMFSDKTVAVFENNQSVKPSSTSNIKYLRSLNGKMLGWVLNKVEIDYADAAQI